MQTKPNFLFIMCDQLRWDYLSCNGHPSLQTPNIDRLAERGVRFDRTYVQSPVCGPSRASFYTGRTVHSHGSTWNGVPLPIGELTLGEYLGPADYRVAVAGKTHIVPDRKGMARLGVTPDTEIGLTVMRGGFEQFDRDDGIHTHPIFARRPQPKYNDWLRSLGYEGKNPWITYANSVEDETGEIISGWDMRSAKYPARLPAEHSESHYITDRAMEFMDESRDRPWLLHLSYIKPHWPYVAPAPYHNMYGPEDVLPVNRSDAERGAHPVFDAFQDLEVSRSFSNDEVRQTVTPAYMGLIKQIDDQIGRVLDYLDETGQADNTVIVFTSDHGDYLGDHWMGEKELFHEPSVRVPLIIFDPRPEADASRGKIVEDMVEAIDLVPTFMEWAGLDRDEQRLEGRSLVPFFAGQTPDDWRGHAFSELDYGYYAARLALNLGPNDAKIFMIRTDRYKYINYLGFAPQLFDLQADPDELNDLGKSPDHADVRAEMAQMLFERLARRRSRVTESDTAMNNRTAQEERAGVYIGRWNARGLPVE